MRKFPDKVTKILERCRDYKQYSPPFVGPPTLKQYILSSFNPGEILKKTKESNAHFDIAGNDNGFVAFRRPMPR